MAAESRAQPRGRRQRVALAGKAGAAGQDPPRAWVSLGCPSVPEAQGDLSDGGPSLSLLETSLAHSCSSPRDI